MKNLLKVAAVLVTAFSLMGSAVAAPCKPVSPADIEGHIQATWPGGASLSASYFLENSCDWGGNDQLNGFDAVVLDVEKIAGTSGNLAGGYGPAALFVISVTGEFLDPDCVAIEGSEVSLPVTDKSYSLDIPAGAKWMLLTPDSVYPSADVTITLHSDGLECKKKKKKGKKK